MIENYPLFTIEKSPDFEGRNRRFFGILVIYENFFLDVSQ